MTGSKSNWVFICGLVLMVVNIAMFALWWTMIRVEVVRAPRFSEYHVSYIGIQITALATIISVVALLFVGLGFIGWKTLRESSDRMIQAAATKAEKEANETAVKIVGKLVGEAVNKEFENRGIGFIYNQSNAYGKSPDLGESTKESD